MTFFAGIGVFELVLDLSVLHSGLHHAPKSSIIKVVYMAINLPPLEIILHHLKVGIEDYPRIK